MADFAVDLRNLPAPRETVRPEFKLTPALLLKVAGCLAVLTVGLYYLWSGKENQSLSRMLVGAVLVLGAFLLFL
ncbi:MAG: hypothetical protein HY927_03420 [Elusimicrobia bacterium]|nr:hypothetical protein [Elusimicrobiota bacterium]